MQAWRSWTYCLQIIRGLLNEPGSVQNKTIVRFYSTMLKGLQLEVGARRAPKLLVCTYLEHMQLYRTDTFPPQVWDIIRHHWTPTQCEFSSKIVSLQMSTKVSFFIVVYKLCSLQFNQLIMGGQWFCSDNESCNCLVIHIIKRLQQFQETTLTKFETCSHKVIRAGAPCFSSVPTGASAALSQSQS